MESEQPARGGADRLPGALVISLDFELHWGVRDRYPVGSPYDARLFGAREVVGKLLDLFREYEVAATWATVGFLFARSREELLAHSPTIRPTYEQQALDPYGEQLGEGEADDPLHFAPSLVEKILATPRQELSTHTFCHYYCGEPGQTAEQFTADLAAARSIAETYGTPPRSIVYPRNQHNAAYTGVLKDAGIATYRGNPTSWMWRFENTGGSARPSRRIGRVVDTYFDISGPNTQRWDEVLQPDGLCNVRASAFLRGYNRRLRHLEPLRLRRITNAMRSAARRGELFHLWWHPHNMGTDQPQNLDFLRAILKEYSKLHRQYGMLSLTMSDVATRLSEEVMMLSTTE
jgi:peptidoglycan/xylan/chitin deacetylase (PgdA/CDA1 family)